ncbi:MAG: hypothetical protein U0K81_05010 [Paludibacteraceae bacterium]|nr:hypothetical protein [Paludibacteraceae bacterium]
MTNINTATSNIPVPDSPIARAHKVIQLTRHTKWYNRQPLDAVPMPNEQEKREIYAGCTMVTLLAALDYFIYDLIEALEDNGKYRFAIKKNVNKARDLILNAHNTFYKRIWSVYQDCSDYNNKMDDYYKAINECIGLRGEGEEIERAYSIVVAMCRLQGKYRRMMTAHTYHPSIEVEKLPAMLECIGAVDRELDNIIERKIKTLAKQ